MEFKDYYQVLGVPPDADEKKIRQAFRKLAQQYHPDVNSGSKVAEEKFKEINEAHQILSDATQRKKYDALRTQYQQFQQGGGHPQDFDWQTWSARPEEGVHVRYGTVEDLKDLFGSEGAYSDFFTSIFGGMREGEGTPRPRRGRDLEFEIEVTLEEAFKGTTRVLTIGERSLEVKIPAGVRTGSRIRLAGQGEPSRNGGLPGDLYLIPRVLPHQTFERDGDDLYIKVPVDIYTAALGGEIRVPTLDGAVMLKIPPQTQSGKTFRLRGKGMPKLKDSGSRGDLYAKISLLLPLPLSEREIKSYQELAQARRKT
jgi:curved DNA-binding protein